MSQAHMMTAGAAGAVALLLFYLTMRVRLVATSGEQQTRTVSQIEYNIAQMNAWMDHAMSAVGRMLMPTLFVMAPLAATGLTLFDEAAGVSFSFRAYFFGLVLVIAPTLIVARRSFNEGRYDSPTSDIAYALKRAASSNRAILLRAVLAAVLYAALLAGALFLLHVAWWIYGICLAVALFASLIVMIGLSD